MATARSGSTGVGLTKGDVYAVDANGNLERLPVGTDGLYLTADSTAATGLSYRTGASRAPIFLGGANMGAGDAGKFYNAQDISNGGKTAALSSANQMSSPITGTIDRLTWNSAAATATTVLRINKNGVTVATVALTGVKGSAVVSVAVTEADLIAVEYNTGTAPGQSTVQVWARR